MRSGVLAKTRPALLRNRRIVFRGLEVGPALNQRRRYRKRHLNSRKRHVNGYQHGCKIDKKSSWRRGGVLKAFGEGPWRPNAPKFNFFGSQFWMPFRAKIGKMLFEKASTNQCKKCWNLKPKGSKNEAKM